MVKCEVRYMLIPDEITYLVEFSDINDVTYDMLDSINYEKYSCICFKGDSEKTTEIINFYEHIIESHENMKVAWLTSRSSMPFKAGYLDYVGLSDGLFKNISDKKGITGRFVDITALLSAPLDPVDPYYFEKLEEKKKENH